MVGGGVRVAPELLPDAADQSGGAAGERSDSDGQLPETLPSTAPGGVGVDRKQAWNPSEGTPKLSHGPTQELYIPLRIAQSKVYEVESHMAAMRSTHLSIMSEMETQYRAIEEDTQAYFAAYIKRLNDAAAQRVVEHTELVTKLSDEALQYRTEAEGAMSDMKDANEVLQGEVDRLTAELGEADATASRLSDRIAELEREVVRERRAGREAVRRVVEQDAQKLGKVKEEDQQALQEAQARAAAMLEAARQEEEKLQQEGRRLKTDLGTVTEASEQALLDLSAARAKVAELERLAEEMRDAWDTERKALMSAALPLGMLEGHPGTRRSTAKASRATTAAALLSRPETAAASSAVGDRGVGDGGAADVLDLEGEEEAGERAEAGSAKEKAVSMEALEEGREVVVVEEGGDGEEVFVDDMVAVLEHAQVRIGELEGEVAALRAERGEGQEARIAMEEGLQSACVVMEGLVLRLGEAQKWREGEGGRVDQSVKAALGGLTHIVVSLVGTVEGVRSGGSLEEGIQKAEALVSEGGGDASSSATAAAEAVSGPLQGGVDTTPPAVSGEGTTLSQDEASPPPDEEEAHPQGGEVKGEEESGPSEAGIAAVEVGTSRAVVVAAGPFQGSEAVKVMKREVAEACVARACAEMRLLGVLGGLSAAAAGMVAEVGGVGDEIGKIKVALEAMGAPNADRDAAHEQVSKLARQLEQQKEEQQRQKEALERRLKEEAEIARERGETEEEKAERERLAEEAQRKAEEEAKAQEAAGKAAQALVKQQNRLDRQRAQVAAAKEKLMEQRAGTAGVNEEEEEMDEDEKAELEQIRQREFEQMEAMLKKKEEELMQQQAANENMQAALARTAEGEAMTAAEMHAMIGQHAQEIEEMRQQSDTKVARLQQELASAREALSADQDVMQDKIDELNEENAKISAQLVEAYAKSEEMEEELRKSRQEQLEAAAGMKEEVLTMQRKMDEMEAAKALEESERTAKDAEEAQRIEAQLQDQVGLAKQKLKEEEQKDREEAKAKGEHAKVVKSAASKEAYWDVERLTQELQGKRTMIEEANAKIAELGEKEKQLKEASEEREAQRRKQAEEEHSARMRQLEEEFEARRQRLDKERAERERLAAKMEKDQAISADAGVLDLLSDLRAAAGTSDSPVSAVAGGNGGGDTSGVADENTQEAPIIPLVAAAAQSKAKAKATAAAAQKKEKAANDAAPAGMKALKEAEKKNRQLEGNISKLNLKIQDLEKKLDQAQTKAATASTRGGAAAAGSAPANPKAAKELEMMKKRQEKSKGELEKATENLAELEKAHKKLVKEHDTSLKELEQAKDAAGKGEQYRAEMEKAKGELSEVTKQCKELEGLYKKEQQLRKKYYNQIEDMKGKIRVYARCRPFAKYEKEKNCQQAVKFLDDMSCEVDVGKKGKKEFTFDEVFREDSKQDQIFEGVSHLVQSAVDGYNVCVFAYGQTGSGKTFTMYGKADDENLWGIAPRAMRELYELVEAEKETLDISVSCYMLELYNDQLVDLLVDKDPKKKGQNIETDKKNNLSIKLDTKGVVVVQGAVVKGPCATFQELHKWNEYGMEQRHVASTAMNAESSRSHLVFSILVETKNKATGAATLGKLTLVDLAGSERQSKTQAQGDRIKEAMSINKSLSALGDVISALSTGEKFVPYRNNKLTQLLQDGLGGNAKTLMFVNISPADYNAEETATSLQYAARVKTITNDASKAQESAEVHALKKIIADLKKGVHIDAKEGGLAEQEEEADPAEDERGGLDDSQYLEGPTFERQEEEDP